MVAFVGSLLITALMAGAILWYAKRRPVGTPLTWGEAMVASVYVFFLLFWIFGIVPHLWLAWADNELRWRPDKLLYGPGDIFQPVAKGGHFPFTISWQTIRDLIATGIYGVFLFGAGAMWVLWQNRGKKAQAVVPRSEYGRPLVKEGA